LTAEEIESYIPKTARERRQAAEEGKNDMEKMKTDVAYLLKQVEELTQIINGTDEGRAHLLKGKPNDGKTEAT
jgi:hypothetical protein